MTKWLELNQKLVLMIVLFLLMILTAFYIFMILPLATEEKNEQQQLSRINDDVSFYQKALKKLTPQRMTEKEKNSLMETIPGKPNVEELIKDLERTELETGVVIENITSSIHSNGLNQNKEAASQNNQPVDQQGQGWETILPKNVLEKFKDQMTGLNNLKVSYVEMAINVNGEPVDASKFVKQLENLNRIIHVQSYEYTINKEKNHRLEGIVTIHAFYCEDFAELLNGDTKFELDYDFNPNMLKRYVDPYVSTDSQLESGSDSTTIGQDNSVVEQPPAVETGSETNRTNTGSSEKTTQADKKTPVYQAPQIKNSGIIQDNPVFYVVQTGAYQSEKYLNAAVQKLMNAGVYPRIIGDNMSYIYTATDSSIPSAEKLVEILKTAGFDSYVKVLPYRLTKDEKAVLLKDSDDLIGSITEIISKGIMNHDSSLTKEQFDTLVGKTKSYEKKVQQAINKTDNKERKDELQETMTILDHVLDIVQENVPNGKADSLWEAEGLILDYMLIFNGYVPTDIKG
ncbi:SPOR domain-containing protein [Neobacillus mesonae]|uniref:SPOR domain-containing protein n=1 Tax=Neobacillus mesonae TaxID=1193713 RepID=UPI00203DF945|nr:SPOR domain-containing protein [Neobacillus mesonae]MCM3568390.1 hypothetical protein [Neobacillus mesonae]